jgi:hypothetical protein
MRGSMNKMFLCILTCLVLYGFPSIILADSLPIKNGRYNGGPVLIMKLTKDQIHMIKNRYSPYQMMVLTINQQKFIGRKAPMKNPPSKIIIARAEDTVNDCTCGLYNIGLILKDNTVEIPKNYLATDEEAEEGAID